MQFSGSRINLPTRIPVRWSAGDIRSIWSYTYSKNAIRRVILITSCSQSFISHYPIVQHSLVFLAWLVSVGFLFTAYLRTTFSQHFIAVLSLRAIGERAHILHPVASFSSLCVLITASRYALFSLRKGTLSTYIIAWYYSKFLWSFLHKPLG